MGDFMGFNYSTVSSILKTLWQLLFTPRGIVDIGAGASIVKD